jgi:hypothetical protein
MSPSGGGNKSFIANTDGKVDASLQNRLIAQLAGLAAWPPAELADNTECEKQGFSSLDAYQQALQLPNVYNATTSKKVFLPIFASHSLEIPDESLTHAVIWIHGLSADANTYFCDGMAAVTENSDPGSILSIAPWFGNVQVSESQWINNSTSAGVSAFWTTTRWLSGGNNSPSPAQYTTSFDVLDAIYEAIVSHSAKASLFPNLKVVTFAGYSAGAQLVSRWAFFTHHGKGKNIKLRFLVSDPGSYMYLDSSRPAASCSPGNSNTTPSHTCADFNTSTSAMQADCPKYNKYKYGVSDLRAVKYNNYIAPFATEPSLVQAQLKDFRVKDIRFIFGTQDVCNCNTAGYDNSAEYCYPAGATCVPNADGGTVAGAGCCDTYPDGTKHNALNVGCESQLEGQNRFQRGLNYMSHVDRFYANQQQGAHLDARASGPVFKHSTYPGGHNNSAFHSSSDFIQWAFVDR